MASIFPTCSLRKRRVPLGFSPSNLFVSSARPVGHKGSAFRADPQRCPLRNRSQRSTSHRDRTVRNAIRTRQGVRDRLAPVVVWLSGATLADTSDRLALRLATRSHRSGLIFVLWPSVSAEQDRHLRASIRLAHPALCAANLQPVHCAATDASLWAMHNGSHVLSRMVEATRAISAQVAYLSAAWMHTLRDRSVTPMHSPWRLYLHIRWRLLHRCGIWRTFIVGAVPPEPAHPLHLPLPSRRLSLASGAALGLLAHHTPSFAAGVIETKGTGRLRRYTATDPDAHYHIDMPRDDRPWLQRLQDWLAHIYLPYGFPHTVTRDYLQFTWWRLIQNTAASVMSVFSTEALLLGLGLGKDVSGTAQAAQWILKDGFGYVGKIAYAALAGKQFDVDPRSWRIMSDALEDVAGVLEIVTPIFSGSFLALASVATTMKAVAAMTGTATRHAIYKSVALAENQGDLATKGESQGVTTKLIGLGLGIALSKRIGQNYRALLGAYALTAAVHLAANYKAMKCIEFSTLNRQRMAMLAERYFHSTDVDERAVRPVSLEQAQLPTPREIGPQEQFMLPPWRNYRPEIVFGSSLRVVPTPHQLTEMMQVYKGERYLLFDSQRDRKVHVLLLEGVTARGQLKAFFNAARYLHDRDAVAAHQYTNREFARFLSAAAKCGWNTSISLLNPMEYRIRL